MAMSHSPQQRLYLHAYSESVDFFPGSVCAHIDNCQPFWTVTDTVMQVLWAGMHALYSLLAASTWVKAQVVTSEAKQWLEAARAEVAWNSLSTAEAQELVSIDSLILDCISKIRIQMSHLCLPLHSLQQADRSKVVVTCGHRTQTAADLHNQVAVLSEALSSQLLVSPGDRIVLLGLNSDLFFSCLLAVLDAGAVACPLNWRWSAAELAAAVDLLQPMVLFVDDFCMPLAQQACSSLAASSSSSNSTRPWTLIRMCCEPVGSPQAHRPAMSPGSSNSSSSILSAGDLLARAQAATGGPKSASPAAAAAGTQPQLQLLQPGYNQPALIVFTSGTTGASKGVMLSHTSIIHQSLAKLTVVQYSSSDTYLHMAPLFHIGGLSSAFAVLMAGGAHVFMPRYSPATALQLIQQHSVSSLIAVPAMMQDLTQAAAAAAAAGTLAVPQLQQQLPSLQKVLVGAGGMPLRLQRAVAALFPNAVLQTAYGMTEASSSMTFISIAQQQELMAQAAAAAAAGEGAVGDRQDPPAAAAAAAGVCVGKPGPGIAMHIASPAVSATSSSNDQQQQQQQQQGLVGEVCTMGPHVMLGYWQDPQATAQALDPAGWLHTGDLGYMDSRGNVWLVGRLKDMVKTGGENVHAAEVEGVLLTHRAVAAAAVFGLEHQRLGEQVAAAVVLQPGWGWGDAGTVLPLEQPHDSQAAAQSAPPQQQQCGVVTAAMLQQHCRAKLLSPYKLPRVVVCAQQLSLNSSGKVVKAQLKQQVQQLLLKARQLAPLGTPAPRSKL